MIRIKRYLKLDRNYQVLIVLNLYLAFISFLIPNKFFIYHSWIIFGCQLLITVPFLIKKIKYVKNLFLPSFFVLIYFLINQILGAYLVPRNYGIDKQFRTDVVYASTYNIIVPYFLLINTALFILSIYSLTILSNNDSEIFSYVSKRNKKLISEYFFMIFLVIFFIITTQVSFSMIFSIQLAILIVLFSIVSKTKGVFKYLLYLTILSLLVVYKYQDKRELIIVFFSIIFLEAYIHKWIIKFSVSKIIKYSLIIITFMFLVISSSILRGYGNFNAKSFGEAINHIPEYISSSKFIDSFVENLELNYSYGTSISAMDQVIRGKIKYQYGLTIVKILFLPIPRKYLPFKPLSSMQLYTKSRNYNYFIEGGSYPISFQCDMFINFHILGMLPFLLIFLILDYIFLKIFENTRDTVRKMTYIYLVITILMLARGSGIELYMVYFIFGFITLVFLSPILKML